MFIMVPLMQQNKVLLYACCLSAIHLCIYGLSINRLSVHLHMQKGVEGHVMHVESDYPPLERGCGLYWGKGTGIRYVY